MVAAGKRGQRIEEILERIEVGGGAAAELMKGALRALSDDWTPHQTKWLADAGHPISIGATTRQIFDYISNTQSRARIDREARDYVFPDLIAVELIEKATIRSRREVSNPLDAEEVVERGRHSVPKSPNSAYVLTREARRLICEVDDADWQEELEGWFEATPERRSRRMRADAARAARGGPPWARRTRG